MVKEEVVMVDDLLIGLDTWEDAAYVACIIARGTGLLFHNLVEGVCAQISCQNNVLEMELSFSEQD